MAEPRSTESERFLAAQESDFAAEPESTGSAAGSARPILLQLLTQLSEEIPDDYVVGDHEEDPESWQERALCAQTDPEAFFPEKGGSTREAKRICQSCEVRTECLEYALAHDERFGIWGGLSERERRRLKRGIA